MPQTIAPELLKLKIAFIGGGNMAEALIGGLHAAGLPGEQLRVLVPEPTRRAHLQERYGLELCKPSSEALQDRDVIVLAVKPQIMGEVVSQLQFPNGVVVVSVAAGLSSDTLRGWISNPVQMVRVMPNTPSLVGAGMSGLYADSSVGPADRAKAEFIASASGDCVWLEEEAQMHALTALSGSGPAYYFLFTEALRNAGIELGLPPALANQLAVATLSGAAAMARQSEDDLETLRAKVTSKGGATAAAVGSFEADDLRRLVLNAASACRNRSIEMGKAFAQDAAE